MSAQTAHSQYDATHIVVLDNNAEEAANVAEALRKCFETGGIQAKVEYLTEPRELTRFLSGHPDVVVCDVSLDGQDDIMGLELIRNNKAKYPHVAFAAMTWNLDQLTKLDQIEIAPDFILPKTLLLPTVDARYAQQVIAHILRNTRQNRSFAIAMPTSIEAALKEALKLPKFDRAAIDCLIRQVFSMNVLPMQAAPDIHVSAAGVGRVDPMPTLIDRVRVTEFDFGGSGSAVFLAVPELGGRPYEVSVVLKFSEIDNYFRELRNFARYVKWTLPYSWRVDVLGVGRIGRIGVIGYSLAFAGSAKANPLLYFFKTEEPGPIMKFIGSVFDEDRQVWYGDPRTEERTDLLTDLTQRYFESALRFNELEKVALDRVEKTQVFGQWTPQVSGNKKTVLQKAIEPLLRRKWVPYQKCVCHGDLHAGNIMASNDGSALVFIDFQDTGLLHVFTDFVVFENAIRKDSPAKWFDAPELSKERAGIEAALSGIELQGGSQGPVGDQLINAVRTRAFENFKAEPRIHYFIHAAIFAILMLRNETLTAVAAERIAALLIACSEILPRHMENARA